jgi:hypothetical protein
MTKIYAWLIAALTKLIVATVILGGVWSFGFYKGFTFHSEIPQPAKIALDFLGGKNGNSK